MRRLPLPLMATVVLAAVIAGCSQAASAPTQAPAAPKATEPAKAVAPQPTAAPAQPTAAPPTAAPAPKVDYPTKGKTITILVGYAAGGGSDIASRHLAAFLEKELGTPVQVVNKAGAAQQLALTELVNSKPDGYTLEYLVLPGGMTTYLDPDRKATYSLKDWQPIAGHTVDPAMLAVQASSSYQNLKDVVDAGKSTPDKVRMGLPGVMTLGHLVELQWMQMTGAKFASVQFEGTAPGITALAGGHIDAMLTTLGGVLPLFKSGQLRVLGVTDRAEHPLMPGVKTFEAQGYKLYGNTTNGLIAPKGTPKEVVDTLSAAVKKATGAADHVAKIEEQALEIRYMDAAEFGTYLADMERELKPLMELAKKQ